MKITQAIRIVLRKQLIKRYTYFEDISKDIDLQHYDIFTFDQLCDNLITHDLLFEKVLTYLEYPVYKFLRDCHNEQMANGDVDEFQIQIMKSMEQLAYMFTKD